MPASLIIAATCAFLITPAAHRPAVALRAAAPLAFEADLSEAELRGVLQHRGITAGSVGKSELVQRLQASSPRASNADPVILSESEARRVDVFERVSPSVAFIQTSLQAGRRGSLPLGAGSGFVWDTEGHIITNYHVIFGPNNGMPGVARQLPRRVMVSLQGLVDPIEAEVVGHEADKDLCVLKVEPAALPLSLRPLETGSSSELRVGMDVLAIGNPFGLDYTLTRGIVSALGRSVDGAGGRQIRDCVQTDAAINPGNSGGPLLDSNGRLVGVNTMIYAPSGAGGNVGIGFAIPADTVRRVVNQILTYGQNARPSIGISLLDDAVRKHYAKGLRRELEGALVAGVARGSPADALELSPCERRLGGILLGDMVTAVDGKPVKCNEDLMCALEESLPGQPLDITLMRNCDPARVEELQVTPVARKALTEAR